jgi:hypothetical protein
MAKFKLLCAVIFLVPSLVLAWGGTGHKIINRNAVIHLPASMQQLIDQQAFLEAHASDADNRKSKDPTESPKHFIDIDTYPNFQNKILNYDSLVSKYGSAFVINEGTLPWATKTTLDSLTAQFHRGDWAKADTTASDLGHYVGDGHQPLHVTNNYDGGSTGNSGIHSRYETKMLDAYQSSVVITRDSVHFVADPFSFVFHYLNATNVYVDSIMIADTQAKAAAGGSTSSSVYLAALWAKCGPFTNQVIQQATVDLASLWYTAWMNAGLLYSITDVEIRQSAAPLTFELKPAYPNPFNPSTTIQFTTASAGRVSLAIYDMLGREVGTLVDADLAQGSYAVQWNAGGASSGVYYCRLQAGSFVRTQKLVLQR